MAIVTLIVCFTCILLSLGIKYTESKKELIIYAVLIFSAILVGITEFSSMLHLLNYSFLFISWSLISLILIIYLYTKKEKVKRFVSTSKIDIKFKLSQATKTEKAFLIICCAILLAIFFQAILYPPNTWDAMAYHMARITSWVSHQSLAHYRTSYTTQLFQPPFAEYVIMNFDILCKSDVFSNISQFLFLLFSLVTMTAISGLLGLSKPYKIIAIILGVTIPEVILQAASTQNDLTEGFFIITACFFAIKIIKEPKLKYYVFAGLAVGLALLTKGIAYVYIPPMLLLLAFIIIVQGFKTKNHAYLKYSLAAIIVVAGINLGHFVRNYNLTYNILGVDKAESKLFSNQKMNAGLLASNVIKNAGLHTGIIFFKPAAVFTNKIIHNLHDIAGINVNDPATNILNVTFSTITGTAGEDGSPNPFHLLFILVSLALVGFNLFRGNRNGVAIFIAASLVLQYLGFCAYLKWQPWHSRLHVPLFLMAVPLICYCMQSNLWFRSVFYWVSPFILIYALLVIRYNDNRPFSLTLGSKNRYEKYFIVNSSLYPEYDEIHNSLFISGKKNIGLLLKANDWEYPLFKDCFTREINPIYLAVNNFSKNIAADTSKIDCIVSTTVNKPFIDFEGKRYTNITNSHKIIWMYQ